MAPMALSVGAMIVSSAIMAGCVYAYASIFFSYAAPGPARAFHLLAAIMIGVVVYLPLMAVSGSSEAKTVVNRLAGLFRGKS